MIQGKNICKSFDGFKALDDLSFNVSSGAVYGLVGPNGAGKSTLLRHIAGIFRADSGNVLIDGEEVFENVEAKAKLVFIPDDVFYFRQASILDMKKYYKGIYNSFDEDMYEKALKCFGELDVKKPIRRMSKGMQKQAAFLLAVSIRPEILLLDEPVDGLDPVMRRQIWNIMLSEVADRGMTVIVSSHNLRELEDVCDHVGIMHHGRLILERSLSELQGNITKVQTAFKDEAPDVEQVSGLEVMNRTSLGRVETYIIRADADTIENKLAPLEPMFLDMLPLTLEEIFIYELGGNGYEVKDILV